MLDKTTSALLVVDIQDKLMPRNPERVDVFLKRVIKLIRCVRALHIPILVTEQNPGKLGGTTDVVAAVLEDVPRHAKMEFGCLDNASFKAALRGAGRQQLLVTGMEGHICVMQTVLRALEEGYETYVVTDGVLSRDDEECRAGLARMERAGAVLATSEMVIFELLKGAGTDDFRRLLPLLKE